MSIDKEKLKKEYESNHGIRNSEPEIRAVDGDGGFADQEDYGAYGANRVNAEEVGVPIRAKQPAKRSDGKRNRRDGVGNGKAKSGGGSYDQDTPTGDTDLGFGTSEPIELDTNRIINVATTPKRTRKPKEPLKKEAVKTVVVDVLAPGEVEETRSRLRAAFVGIFKATDDFINLSVANKPEQRIYIWTLIDDREIDVLVNARISRARKSVLEARIVRTLISVYEQFETGLILFPRLWQTAIVYDIYGFRMPGSDFGKNRRKKNLRVVESEPSQGSNS